MRLDDERFTLIGSPHGIWLAVQRIRLGGADVDGAVDIVRRFMQIHGIRIASWWVSDRSTPPDAEARLLARGLSKIESDYLIHGLLAASPPPPGPSDVAVDPVANLAEFVSLHEIQYEATDTPPERRADRATLEREFELDRQSDVVAYYCARRGERIVGGGRAIFTPRGVLLAGGFTIPSERGRGVYRAVVRRRWDDAVARGTPALAVQAGSLSAPILRRLGFEQVCRFRRLEGRA